MRCVIYEHLRMELLKRAAGEEDQGGGGGERGVRVALLVNTPYARSSQHRERRELPPPRSLAVGFFSMYWVMRRRSPVFSIMNWSCKSSLID
jgi:hypothetical protein